MPKCKEHPEEEATYRCQSCWKEYCERCVKEKDHDTMVCPECELLVADLVDLI
jgi:DNA-directed RNA polymerase subunit RPC12/RpoP